MKWPDIIAAANKHVEELREARKSGLTVEEYCVKKNLYWGRSCIFFPITQTVGVKIYVKHWAKGFKDSLMYTSTLAAEGMAPPIFYSKEYDDYGIMIVGIGEYLPGEVNDDEMIRESLMQRFHARLKKMHRFIMNRWHYYPSFAQDYAVKNFGLYCGKLVYLDCNVDY